MISLLLSFFASTIATLFIIRYQHLHKKYTRDYDLLGVQKFHAVPVPRIGGIGIVCGVVVGLTFYVFIKPEVAKFGFDLLVCSLPAFLAGLLEDITKKVGVKARLFFTGLSGLLGGMILGGWIAYIQMPIVDTLLSVGIISIVLTCIAISGVANAYNIIDGYNGLAGVVSIMSFFGIAYVGWHVGDQSIFYVSVSMAGAIAGFLVWNFPKGLVFLGDGGAYLIGFIVAELSLLLVCRNPNVSPWFPLLLSFYPIFETLFSIYRKKVKRGMSPGVPDGLHLHMLIYKRMVRWAIGTDCIKSKTKRNALTSPYLWAISSLGIVPAILFWNNTPVLMFFVAIFAIVYVRIYQSIVRRKVPQWLVIRSK